MKRHTNLNSVVKSESRFRKEISLKSMSKANFRIAETVSIPGKIIMIVLALFITNIADAQVNSNNRNAVRQSIKTVYPTKDWVIADFVVTDPRFGAKAEPGFDNRAAFQAAIDAAYKSGGGVVFIPAGHYEFHSTRPGTKTVRVRQGSTETMKDFQYQYVLNLPTSVQLRGDWADPELHNGKVLGTVLEVRVGENAPNYNGTVESWWNDPQADNALHTTYTSIADRFINMNPGTGVTNLSIWYPEQQINHIKPYP